MISLDFLLDQGIRLAGVFQWAVLIYWLLKKLPNSTHRSTLVAFCVAVIGYLSTPIVLAVAQPTWVQILIFALMFASPVLLWITAKATFEDGFVFKLWYFVIGAIAIVVDLGTYWASPFSASLFQFLKSVPHISWAVKLLFPQILTYVFLFLAIYEVRRGTRSDLLEDRLKFRKNFIFFMSLMAFLIATGDIYMKFDRSYLHVLLALMAAPVLVSGYLLSKRLMLGGADFFSADAPEIIQPQIPAFADVFSDAIISEFQRFIIDERVYLRSSFDLEEFAKLLKVPDYRLRRHINQKLGYKNFNQFLNHYRIEEAKRILSSENGKMVPIYNLALELGYGSVVSFQRAFKSIVGVAPSEFKRMRSQGSATYSE